MNTGGPAFPLTASTGDSRDGVYCQNGMTLLDWYAGQALPAVVADSLAFNLRMMEAGKPPVLQESDVAKQSYVYASAMLAEKARREADHSGDVNKMVPNHSPDAGNMAELQAANRELVEALEGCLENLERWCPVKHREARDILSKHKGVA